ncbi:MAG: quinoprotein relay system zinc metallohydrolase 2 [Pseudomonadota bacterium]
MEIREVAPGVFVHRGEHAVPNPANAGDLANLGFVVGEDAVAVIDAGGSRQVAEGLYAAIRLTTDLPIRWLIVTHMHPDHGMGAELFKEAGATMVGHENLSIALANRAESYTTAMMRLMGEKAFLGTRIAVPDRTDVTTIDLGGRTLQIQSYETAHTNTDLTILDQKTGTLFTGDLVFVEHTPALDGSILGWQAVLGRMADADIKQIVPGHGPSLMPWPKGADPTRGYLAALTEETRKAIAAGESMRRAIKHLGESQRSNWQMFDEYNKRNATAAYKELEWE